LNLKSEKPEELYMDFNASLRRAIKTGNVILGQNNTEK
jgi:ribosomal protein L30E